jgi:hypothetical protein
MERTRTHITQEARTALRLVNLTKRKTKAQVRAQDYSYNGQADVTQNELTLEGRNCKRCDEISEDFPNM